MERTAWSADGSAPPARPAVIDRRYRRAHNGGDSYGFQDRTTDSVSVMFGRNLGGQLILLFVRTADRLALRDADSGGPEFAGRRNAPRETCLFGFGFDSSRWIHAGHDPGRPVFLRTFISGYVLFTCT